MPGLIEARLHEDLERARRELNRERTDGARARLGGPGRAQARRRLEAAEAALGELERRVERLRATGRSRS